MYFQSILKKFLKHHKIIFILELSHPFSVKLPFRRLCQLRFSRSFNKSIKSSSNRMCVAARVRFSTPSISRNITCSLISNEQIWGPVVWDSRASRGLSEVTVPFNKRIPGIQNNTTPQQRPTGNIHGWNGWMNQIFGFGFSAWKTPEIQFDNW